MVTFVGGDQPDLFTGTDGPDTIEGGRGQDNLSGGAGNDSFTASVDADYLSGGAGDDYFQISVCAMISGGSGRDTFKFGEDGTAWTFTPIGQPYDFGAQTIITDFNVNEDIIDFAGMFTRTGRVGQATYSTYASNPFASGGARLVDTADGVQLFVGDKPLVLLQGVRADQLTASNFTPGRSDEAVMQGSMGTGERIVTTVVIDPRTGPPPNQTIDGIEAGETIQGASGNDSVRGFGGNDLIYGWAGNDDINGNQGNDQLDGGFGNDWVRGGQGNDTMSGAEGDDPHVNGNLGNDSVYGGTGNDFVFGGQGNDTLNGEAGEDQLSGDLGDDILYGGAGADRYLFGAGQGRDWIMDWNAAEGDRIYLPRGQAYTITSYQNQVMIEMDGGAGLGLQLVPESQFSRDYIIFV